MANPFDQLFDPSNHSSAFSEMTGTIGKAFGMNTNQQNQAAAQASAMHDLAELTQSGLSPQQAITKYLATPAGMQTFSTPGALDGVLKTFTDAVTPPAPTAIQTGPGQSTDTYQNGKKIGTSSQPTSEVQNMQGGVPQPVQTPAGSKTTVYQNGQPTNTITTPTDQLQNFSGLVSQMGAMPPEQMKALAQAALLPAGDQQKTVALEALVNSGAVSSEWANMFHTGALEIKELLNTHGDKTGQYVVTNKLLPSQPSAVIQPGSVMPTSKPFDGAPAQAPNPGRPVPGAQTRSLPPAAVNPDGTIDINKAIPPTDKRSMFLGVGTGAVIQSYLGAAVRQFDPANKEQTSMDAELRRDQIQQLDTALTGVASDGRLKARVDSWRKLAPSFGPLESAQVATQKGIQLYDFVEQSKQSELQTSRDIGLSKDTRKEAEQNVLRLQNVLDALPARADMVQLRQDIVERKANAPSIPGVVGTAIGAVKDLGKGVADTVTNARKGVQAVDPKSFATMDETAIAKVPYQQLNPQAQQAYKQRLQQIIQSRQKLNYSDEPSQNGSVQQFLQNPDGRPPVGNRPANPGKPGTRKTRGNLSDEKLMSIHVDTFK